MKDNAKYPKYSLHASIQFIACPVKQHKQQWKGEVFLGDSESCSKMAS